MTDAEMTELLRPFTERGGEAYAGEAVSVLDHSLQTAHMAEEAGVSSSEIASALLHDIGHLVHEQPGSELAGTEDTHHEEEACAYLSRWFDEDVLAPVRLHVAAKRYLCTTEKGYMDRLSEASRASLQLQGGPMFGEELAEFLRSPFAEAAVRIRRWDDAAKVPGSAVPDLDHYERHLKAAAKIRPA